MPEESTETRIARLEERMTATALALQVARTANQSWTASIIAVILGLAAIGVSLIK